MYARRFVAVLFACIAPLLQAQTVDPFYAGTYSATDLGSISGLPTPYGGLIFKAGDPNTILIGGAANTSAGRFYSVPVTRGAGGHIVSLGAPTLLGYGVNNDGGVAYGPGGVLFYSEYSINNVGQVKPGSTSDDKTVALGPVGIASSTGALNFVPAGYNGAGQFKISSWPGGQFYNVTFAADGSGTFNFTGASLVVTLPGGPEGFIYVPLGSALFPSQSMLVAEYSAGTVVTYTIDASGNPVLASRKVFISGLTGAEGAAIDPVTGDFLFSTFGGTNRVIQVRGFVAPVTLAATTTVVTSSVNPSTSGQSVTFTATVNGASPTGTVTFQDGGINITGCVGVALVGVTATCTTSALAVGIHPITGNYSGDVGNSGSTGSVSQTVNGSVVSTTTVVTSSGSPSTAGQSVTFTATVTGTSPTGTVTFQDGGINITSCVGVALVGTTATCTTSTLAVGSHVITGSYSGNAGNAASTGSVTQTVNAAVPPPIATNIPTLAQWGLTMLMVLLAGLGVMRVRRTGRGD